MKKLIVGVLGVFTIATIPLTLSTNTRTDSKIKKQIVNTELDQAEVYTSFVFSGLQAYRGEATAKSAKPPIVPWNGFIENIKIRNHDWTGINGGNPSITFDDFLDNKEKSEVGINISLSGLNTDRILNVNGTGGIGVADEVRTEVNWGSQVSTEQYWVGDGVEIKVHEDNFDVWRKEFAPGVPAYLARITYNILLNNIPETVANPMHNKSYSLEELKDHNKTLWKDDWKFNNEVDEFGLQSEYNFSFNDPASNAIYFGRDYRGWLGMTFSGYNDHPVNNANAQYGIADGALEYDVSLWRMEENQKVEYKIHQDNDLLRERPSIDKILEDISIRANDDISVLDFTMFNAAAENGNSMNLNDYDIEYMIQDSTGKTLIKWTKDNYFRSFGRHRITLYNPEGEDGEKLPIILDDEYKVSFRDNADPNGEINYIDFNVKATYLATGFHPFVLPWWLWIVIVFTGILLLLGLIYLGVLIYRGLRHCSIKRKV